MSCISISAKHRSARPNLHKEYYGSHEHQEEVVHVDLQYLDVCHGIQRLLGDRLHCCPVRVVIHIFVHLVDIKTAAAPP